MTQSNLLSNQRRKLDLFCGCHTRSPCEGGEGFSQASHVQHGDAISASFRCVLYTPSAEKGNKLRQREAITRVFFFSETESIYLRYDAVSMHPGLVHTRTG
jgi:hypothetical protein